MAIWARDNSHLEIEDGDIRHNRVLFENNSTGNILGGDFNGNDIFMNGSNTVDIFGGVFDESHFSVASDSVLTLHGIFNRDYGTLTSLDSGLNLTGELSSGDSINVDLSLYDAGTIVLVPEPATFTLFVFGLGAIVIRKRQRN